MTLQQFFFFFHQVKIRSQSHRCNAAVQRAAKSLSHHSVLLPTIHWGPVRVLAWYSAIHYRPWPVSASPGQQFPKKKKKETDLRALFFGGFVFIFIHYQLPRMSFLNKKIPLKLSFMAQRQKKRMVLQIVGCDHLSQVQSDAFRSIEEIFTKQKKVYIMKHAVF